MTGDRRLETEDHRPNKDTKTLQGEHDFIAKKQLALEDKIDALAEKIDNYHADVMMIAEEVLRRKTAATPLSPQSHKDTKTENVGAQRAVPLQNTEEK